jgi:hypothetical protein
MAPAFVGVGVNIVIGRSGKLCALADVPNATIAGRSSNSELTCRLLA